VLIESVDLPNRNGLDNNTPKHWPLAFSLTGIAVEQGPAARSLGLFLNIHVNSRGKCPGSSVRYAANWLLLFGRSRQLL
jgi:hypothetical protein